MKYFSEKLLEHKIFRSMVSGRGALIFIIILLINKKRSGPQYSNLKNLLMFINLFKLNEKILGMTL